MTDLLTEKMVITQIIELYKANDCLWNPKHKMYKNAYARENAYHQILEKYQLWDKRANIYLLRKKFEIMRNVYRREYTKTLVAEHEGRAYKCRLWYFDLFNFLNEIDTFSKDKVLAKGLKDLRKEINGTNTNSKQKASDEDIESSNKTHKMSKIIFEGDDNNCSITCKTEPQDDDSQIKSDEIVTYVKIEDSEYVNSKDMLNDFVNVKKEKICETATCKSESQNNEFDNNFNDIVGDIKIDKTDYDHMHSVMQVTVNVKNEQEANSGQDNNKAATAFKEVLELQLSELEPDQKYIAEKLISHVMCFARMEKLTPAMTIKLNENGSE